MGCANLPRKPLAKELRKYLTPENNAFGAKALSDKDLVNEVLRAEWANQVAVRLDLQSQEQRKWLGSASPSHAQKPAVRRGSRPAGLHRPHPVNVHLAQGLTC